MEQTLKRLHELLGEERLNEIATKNQDGDIMNLHNAQEIYCECNTLILKPNTARLILPDDYISTLEKETRFLQQGDKSFKNLARGCYWLVDDMYKFEQMGFTRVVPRNEPSKDRLETDKQESHGTNSNGSDDTHSKSTEDTLLTDGLRYLACAECNVCPLGWMHPQTKESYLFVW